MVTSTEAFDKLPKSVRIGPYDFAIIGWTSVESNSAKSYGECSTQEQKIRILREMSSREKLVDTFLHEVLHAIFWTHSIQEDWNEELTVTNLSTALLLFFKANPDVLTWIEETLNPKAPEPVPPHIERVEWKVQKPAPTSHDPRFGEMTQISGGGSWPEVGT